MSNYASADLEVLYQIRSALKLSKQQVLELNAKVRQYFHCIDYQLAHTVKAELANIDRLEAEIQNVPENSHDDSVCAYKRKELFKATETLKEIRQQIARYEYEKNQLWQAINELNGDIKDSTQRGIGVLSASITALENYLKIGFDSDGRNHIFEANSKIDSFEEVMIKTRFQKLGVKSVNLEDVPSRHQEKIIYAFEEMYAKYPQLNGYITNVGVDSLNSQVIACAGPKMSTNGFTTQILFNKDRFASSGLESYIKKMNKENWKGECWLAGDSIESIVKHEIAHILQLEANAYNNNMEIGSNDMSGYDATLNDYMHNDIINTICVNSLNELNMGNSDISKQLSRYARQDYGECFAEAISEMETSHNPRPLAKAISKRYKEYIDNRRSIQ